MTYSSLMEQAETLVSACSVPPHLIGFTFLSEAVVIKSYSASNKLTDIYRTIAKKYNLTHRAVTRDIKYAISKADDICNALSVNKQEVFNGRVIAELARKLKSSETLKETDLSV